MVTRNDKAEMIMPPNTLRVKLGAGSGSGGVSIDPDAVKRAEKAMDDLKVEFNDWLKDDIAALNDTFAIYTNSRSHNNAGALFRAAHDLKGQATTFEYPLIARIASSLAKLMEGLQTMESTPIPLVAAHVDAIHVIHRDQIKDRSNLIALTLAEELEARVMMTLERAAQGA
jgi:chemotaxis protein histidine kinase CheA